MNRRRILIALALVAMACGAAWLLLHPREPSYKGKRLTEWLERYHNPGGFAPEAQANEAVREMGADAIPELLRMLRSRDTDIRIRVEQLAFKYHVLRTKPDPASDRIIKATYAFYALGPAASNAVPELIEIYEQGLSTEIQRHTAGILSSIGPAARPAVPTLLKGLKSTNDWVRRSTVAAFGLIGGEPQTVVPALIKCLSDSDLSVQLVAARSLGEYGADARAAVPDLKAMLMNPTMIIIAAPALKQIDPDLCAQPEALLPALINSLKTPNALNQIWACDTLLTYGTNSRPALSAVVPLLANGNPAVRIMAGRALKHIAPEIQTETTPPATALAHELKNRDGDIRANAAYALGLMGSEAKPAIPDLVQALTDSHNVARTYAEMALKQLDPEAYAKAMENSQRTNSATK